MNNRTLRIVALTACAACALNASAQVTGLPSAAVSAVMANSSGLIVAPTNADVARRGAQAADWNLWADAATNYYAISRRGDTALTNTSFSTLLQDVCNRSHNYAHIHVASSFLTPSNLVHFLFDGPVRVNGGVQISGEGNPQTRFDYRSGYTTGGMLIYTNSSTITAIDHIRFVGAGEPANTNTAVFFQNAAEPVIRNCEFTSFGGSALVIEPATVESTWGYLDNVWFVAVTNLQPMVRIGGVGATVAEFGVNSCQFNHYLAGLDIGTNARNVRVTGNRFAGTYHASMTEEPAIIFRGGMSGHLVSANSFRGYDTATEGIRFVAQGAAWTAATAVVGNSMPPYSGVAGYANSSPTGIVHVGANVLGVVQRGNSFKAMDDDGWLRGSIDLELTSGTTMSANTTNQLYRGPSSGIMFPGSTAEIVRVSAHVSALASNQVLWIRETVPGSYLTTNLVSLGTAGATGLVTLSTNLPTRATISGTGIRISLMWESLTAGNVVFGSPALIEYRWKP